MEDNNVDMITTTNTTSTPPNTGSNGSRWNPTKDQINLLESLYNQGIRTPTAEQIQHITGMLRAFGHIEGKNVFYWFQNHKARQRQKQKQDNLAYFSHFHYQYPPLYLQHCPNVIYRPYYVAPQGDIGFYPKSPGLFVPSTQTAGYNGKFTRVDKMNKTVPSTTHTAKCSPETLDLFPLLPTGILKSSSMVVDDGFSDSTPVSHSSEIDCCDGDGELLGARNHQAFFDFFSGNGHCETTQ